LFELHLHASVMHVLLCHYMPKLWECV